MRVFDMSVNSLRIVLVFILIWLIYKSFTAEYSIGSSSNNRRKRKLPKFDTKTEISNLRKRIKNLNHDLSKCETLEDIQESLNAIKKTLRVSDTATSESPKSGSRSAPLGSPMIVDTETWKKYIN